MSLVWQSVPKAFPSGEGGSRVPRKRETDEGQGSLYTRKLWENGLPHQSADWFAMTRTNYSFLNENIPRRDFPAGGLFL